MLKHCLCRLLVPPVIRTMSRSSNSSYALIIKEFGDPCKVMEKVDTSDQVSEDSSLNDGQVLVKFKASPINPADINTIQGTYGVKPKLPTVGGGEGVAEVIKVSSSVTKVKPGDHVIPNVPGYGTWRNLALVDHHDILPVDKDLDIYCAAQLAVNPPTAYRMLKDFVDLKPGDSVLQNGANSAVGVYVIQLAKIWGLKTINVVRSRPNKESMEILESDLKYYGADHIITDQQLRDREVMDRIWSSGTPKPKLALNCIAGENATNCVRHIAHGGTMVTYGGMSKQPLTVPVGLHIFNDIKFCAYWMTRWRNSHKDSPAFREMMDELVRLFKEKKLKAPKVIPIPMTDYKTAFEKATKPFIEGKVVMIT